MKSYHESVAQVSEGVAHFFKSVFTSVEIDGPAVDGEQVQKNPVMVVSTHRSHVDYFLAGKILYFKGFRNLRFAAGDNLTKLPWIGPKFRNFGAFTVSRSNGFERNYVRNLCNDVVEMMQNGDTVLVFPEGGRSYSGEMLPIRGGILNAAIILQARYPDKDITILPMSVSYERAPDVPWFSLLLKAKKYRKKNTPVFKRLLGNIFYFGADVMAFFPVFFYKIFKRKYGAIYCDYGEPFSVRERLDIEKNRNTKTRDEFFAHRQSLDQLSAQVHDTFLSLYRILPVHVVSRAINDNGADLFSNEECEKKVSFARDEAKSKGLNVRSVESVSCKVLVQKGLEQLEKLKAIKRTSSGIKVVRSDLINYYSSALNLCREEKKIDVI
ncbi:1-acyl-sn-glycerol-3-phosphate acyltransferase [Chitinispirillales bacterium ANBcel5]|uniref:1-acyl-sn-glycerol-3-phosphate acyltransferase n=1 Tax=Cellulosispirillum alkaliphilum TaxID=3039283 RepID=UPI002A51A723|nr:1-acyl-sn-glycerol-3-phosphate acyltransferase [Chitinispirillales bacterium ANBcel5]